MRGGVGEPSASTQHHCRGSQQAREKPWAAGRARDFASQPGETSLHPVGGYLPSCCPTTLDCLGPLWVFCFWRRQSEEVAVPSSLLNPACLGHRLAASSCGGELGLCTSLLGPLALQTPQPQQGSTRSAGHLCCTPASFPANGAGGGCRRKGVTAQHALTLVTCQPPFPIDRHGLGLFLNRRRYEVFS